MIREQISYFTITALKTGRIINDCLRRPNHDVRS